RLPSHLLLMSRFALSHAGDPLHLVPFPTRRSSDLTELVPEHRFPARRMRRLRGGTVRGHDVPETNAEKTRIVRHAEGADCEILRSEEHTSELQSPDHLVCRLLLEKKNKI